MRNSSRCIVWTLTLLFTCVKVQSLTIAHQSSTTKPPPPPTEVPPDGIGQLEGEAGYRMATLQWKFPELPENQGQEKSPSAFRVRYCERHTWGLHRCRYQIVDSLGNSSHRTGRKEKKQQPSVSKTLIEKNGLYKIDIGGLRMATNYSFEIMPQPLPHEWDNHIEGSSAQISLQTKGFSAKASSCLADSSVVVVETGPFFGGRISVENSQSPACALKGDPQSSATQYTLKIRHEECGCVVNDSKVTTVILVQENLPILTHSARRFVVVCTFSPESFIVKAGVNLPRGSASVGKSMDFSRLIRVSSKNNKILVIKKDDVREEFKNKTAPVVETDETPSEPEDEPASSQLQDLDNNDNLSDQAAEESSADDGNVTSSDEDSKEDDGPEQSISELQEYRQRQSRAYLHSSEMNSNHLPSGEGKRPMSLVEPRSRSGHDEGTVEGYIVFGMVVIVIVSGLASVLWFIKSSYKSGTVVGVDQHQDDSSSISGGSSSGRTSQLSSVCNSFQVRDGESSLESQYEDEHSHSHSLSSDQQHRAPRNLDTRSELEVELDFEFSEEIHAQHPSSSSPTGNNNSYGTTAPKRFTLELDETCQQLSSASQA